MDQELIVVGMRYNPCYARSNIKNSAKLYLVLEPENDTNTKAIAVHYISSGSYIEFSKDTRIGYIRDLDLGKVPRIQFNNGVHLCYYEVDRICPNYLRIVKRNQHGKPNIASSNYITTRNMPRVDSISELVKNPIATSTSTNMNILKDWAIGTGTITGEMLSNGTIQYTNHTAATNVLNAEPKQSKLNQGKQMNSMNSNSMMQSMFRKLDNVALDMQTGKLGVKTPTGIVVATDDGVSVNPITEMGFTIPAFAMRVPVDQLQRGDILIGASQPSFFREGSKVGYLTTTLDGVFQETGIVSNMLFGKNTVLAVKNLFGDNDQEGGMNPMFMMAMMGDDKGDGSGFDFKKMMMMQMMMGQSGGGAKGMNPIMMAMAFGKDLF